MTTSLRKRRAPCGFLLLAGALACATCRAEDIPATLEWSRQVALGLPVSGVVRRVYAEAGERVGARRPLLTLDDAALRARVAEDEAILARRAEETAQAARELQRAQNLYERSVIATAELEHARLDAAAADARLHEAQARLVQDGKALQDATLRAPFDSIVIARRVEPGAVVYAGLAPQVLFVLAKEREMVARAELPADRLGRHRVGELLTVLAAGAAYPGVLRSIEAKAESGGKVSYTLRAVFRGAALPTAGLAATIRFDKGERSP